MTPEQINAFKQAYAGMKSYSPGDALSFDVGTDNPYGVMGTYQSPINENWANWLKGAEQTGYKFNPATNAWEMQGLNSAREQSAYSIPVGYNYTDGNELPYVIGADGELKMANTDFSSPDQFAQSFNQSRSVSPLDYNQFRQVSDYVSGSEANDFVDVMGRVIAPGANISVKDANGNVAGKYVFAPPTEIDQNGVPYLNADPEHTNANWMTDPKSWQWQPATEGAKPPVPIFNALQNAGIAPKSAYGNFLDQGLINSLSATASLVGGTFGAMYNGGGGGLTATTGATATSGTTGTLGGEAISISEALANGATYSDLAAMGFDKAAIAMNAGQVAANELANLGLNQGLSNAIVKAGSGAATGAVKSTITGGDPLQGAIKGGLGTVVGGVVKSGLNGLGDLVGDITTGDMDDMNMDDMSMDDMNMDDVAYTDVDTIGGNMGEYDDMNMDDMNMDDLGLDEDIYNFDDMNMDDMNMDENDPYAVFVDDKGGIDWGKVGSSALGTAGKFDWAKLFSSPAVQGALGLGSTLIGSNAAGNATDAQIQAQREALALNAAQYAQNRADFKPFLDEGYSGLNQLKTFDQMAGLGTLPSYQAEVTDKLPMYNEDPATKAMKALGQTSLQRNLNARGLNYGATGASAGAQLDQQFDQTGYDKYKGDLSSRYAALQGEYATKYGQNSDAYNKIMNSIKVGQGAAGSVASAGQNYVDNATKTTTSLGDAAAQGSVAQANVWKNFAQGLGNLYTDKNSSEATNTTTPNQGWWG